MISSSTRDFRPWRHAGLLAPLMLLALSCGCGPSGQDKTGTTKEVEEDKRYRIEGTGKSAQKVLIRRKEERIKELREKN